MFAMTLLGFTIGTIWAIMFFVVWVMLAFWPARVAGRKGHSFWGYFIFSLFFFPLALLVAYMSGDKSKQSQAQPPAPAAE